ncbi:MAG: TrmJ/YjtD family RNA methyltransferase [Candidatus Diapherotrites archaeon]|nr:TrmJ/YjtD family RNA methyltransferase [Candidatus Diapherotrites archaeon]
MARVVLVEPEGEENVGLVARAMANFGQKELVLVNPCPLRTPARARAMHAHGILRKARHARSMGEAVEGADLVVGTTAKTIEGSVNRSFVTLREPSERLPKGDIALVFGRESRGLTTEELAQCDLVVHIPTNKSYKSMNLALAVGIVLYELFACKANEYRVARSAEKAAFLERVEEIAFDPEVRMRNPKAAVRMVRSIVSRAFVSGRELGALHALISRVYEAFKRK